MNLKSITQTSTCTLARAYMYMYTAHVHVHVHVVECTLYVYSVHYVPIYPCIYTCTEKSLKGEGKNQNVLLS